jgi:hypothetical protein
LFHAEMVRKTGKKAIGFGRIDFGNIEHRTPNSEHRIGCRVRPRFIRRPMFPPITCQAGARRSNFSLPGGRFFLLYKKPFAGLII